MLYVLPHRTFRREVRRLLCIAVAGLAPGLAQAEVLRCGFPDLFSWTFFITSYEDGRSARLGVAPDAGDRATVTSDRRTGARVVVEVNVDGVPITMTTIQPDLSAVYSRHVLGLAGEVSVPSQQRGRCERVTPWV